MLGRRGGISPRETTYPAIQTVITSSSSPEGDVGGPLKPQAFVIVINTTIKNYSFFVERSTEHCSKCFQALSHLILPPNLPSPVDWGWQPSPVRCPPLSVKFGPLSCNFESKGHHLFLTFTYHFPSRELIHKVE